MLGFRRARRIDLQNEIPMGSAPVARLKLQRASGRQPKSLEARVAKVEQDILDLKYARNGRHDEEAAGT